ncbi:MAG: winged helix-turn-helix domain-containing protein [Gammaproteobacteria bacterium]|nr:winged helix-turn-helix domain-containing protein [Gammaproteobacteria bacterium]
MIYRFSHFQLDDSCRELRLHGQEIALQPRVFDVLVYLLKNRDWVVSKEKLLEALWPGMVVVDNVLQRAMSLARGALREAGAGDAIRTYAKQGYRFCLDVVKTCSAVIPMDTAIYEHDTMEKSAL